MNFDPILSVNIGHNLFLMRNYSLYVLKQLKTFQSYIGLIYGREIIFYYYVNNFKK